MSRVLAFLMIVLAPVLAFAQGGAAIRAGAGGDAAITPEINCAFSYAEPASETFDENAQQGTVIVNFGDPSCVFTVIIPGAEAWLSVTPTAAEGTATITYVVLANGTVDTRVATFAVVYDNISLPFEVVQQGSDPLPMTPPAAASTPSPVDGAVDVGIGVVLSANEATDWNSCTILFDTVSPPVTEIDLGSSCTYAPTLSFSTHYYWILKRTNAYGMTPSAEWDFTTIADPTPIDPDPTCTSTTTSPTGYNPVHWTPCRQDTYDHMEADYIAACPAGVAAALCSATPATRGGKLFKENKRIADGNLSGGSIGAFEAFIVQATGCATVKPGSGGTYAQSAYTKINAVFSSIMSKFNPAPYDFLYITDNNRVRIFPLKLVAVIDTIKPCLSVEDFDIVNMKMAKFNQSSRLDGYQWNGLGINDLDNAVGQCFGIWVHYYRNPTMPLAIENFTNYNPVTGISKNNIGGLDPSANLDLETFDPSDSSRTCRDALKWWLSWLSPNMGGETAEYDLDTLTFWIMGWDALKTITGEDHFPEVLTLLEGSADQMLAMWTPDLKEHIDWGDTEGPHTSWARTATTVNFMQLAGALQGTTRGRKLNDLFEELVAVHGFASVSGSLSLYPHNANPLFLYNPYDTAVEWRASTSWFDPYVRYTSRKSSATATTGSQLWVYGGGPDKWNATLGKSMTGQHQPHAFGDWSLYCNGGWCMNRPIDYGGPWVVGADGGNVPVIYGRSRTQGYNRMTVRHDASYSSILMQQGGSRNHDGYCGFNPASAPPFVNEWTRAVVYVPGSSTVIVYDRGDVLTSITNYDTCYSATQRKQMDVFKALDKELIINHTYTSPTQNGNVFTWTADNGTAAKMSFLFPTANLSHTIVDETEAAVIATPPTPSTDPSFGYNWRYDSIGCTNCTFWEYKYSSHHEMLRYHVRTRITTDLQFNTFLSVHEFGTAGTTVALEDAGKFQGVHVNPATGNDFVALFNSQQGSAITASYRHPDHQTQVPAQFLRETGGTFTWYPSTTSTLMMWHGLNPANTWSYTVDGGAPVSITPDDGNVDGEQVGHWSGTVTTTAGVPHTIVITGT